ncbi:ComF family protein [Lentilactobacillus fungorum]|uniref:ComF family protein n=1 Tax=Lentilactobacillus fungorum TaxID=2201250 RepID=UPI0019409B1E|nr:phosphoribosyltransferase family protein [Lentilactobacillus fungorum]
MKNCLLCQASIREQIGLDDLFSLRAAKPTIICQACASAFSRLSATPVCQLCGRKLTAAMTDPCYDCQRWEKQAAFSFSNRGLYDYNAAMKTYMSRYKFLGDYRLRWVFMTEMKVAVTRTKRLVVPIPVTEATMAIRGFNQVVGLIDNCRFVNALTPVAATKESNQSAKSRADRLLLDQPFKLVSGMEATVKDAKIVIVDDVYTTGTTIRHAARLLYQAGATSVTGITLAR